MAELMLSGADNGRTVQAHPGDRIVVRLPENATTGYAWAVEGLEAPLALHASTPHPPQARGIGGTGERVLEFTAQQPGAAQIRLQLRREWQGEAGVAEHFAVTVQVSA